MNESVHHVGLHSCKILIAAFWLSTMGIVLHAIAESSLNEKCYSDAGCLAREATKNISQIKPERLGRYIADLARLAMFGEARLAAQRIDRSGQLGQLNWRNANREIAVQEVAAQAWNAPGTIGSFSAFDSLSKLDNQSVLSAPSLYSILADTIIHRSPWGAMDVNLNQVFRPKTLRQSNNATLTELLETRWPQAIEQLPKNKQGLHWNRLAEVWLELGNRSRAEEAVTQAEEVGLVDFRGVQIVYDQTWRTWLELGNYARAERAIDRVSNKPSAAYFRIDIARYFIKAGRKDEGLAKIAAALPDLRLEPLSGQRMNFLRAVVALRLAAGDTAGARAVAEEMATLAHQPDLIPAGQLAQAAAGFNNLGDHEAAAKLLQEATVKIPGKQQVVGQGVTLGTITGATLELTDSLRSQIAIEFYRSGKLTEFESLQQQMGTWYRTHTWLALCNPHGLSDWTHPSEKVCLNGAGNSILLDWAVNAIAKGDLDTANLYLTRAIKAYKDADSVSAISTLLNAARAAFAGDNKQLADMALVAAARAADNLIDRGDREVALAGVAALRKELLF